MALPILHNWANYFTDYHEGLGSSYERIILNQLLLNLKRRYKFDTVLEAPTFGFTGITGLNSIVLSRSGCNVTLLDHDSERVDKIQQIHRELNAEIDVQVISSYHPLPYADKSFDFSWNFSALWFVEDLSAFLSELCRVTSKAILLCVPNRDGLGYKWQKAHSDIPSGLVFNENNIDPILLKAELKKLNWILIREDYIDCPPWPDIGMNKEKFLGSYLSKIRIKSTKERPRKQVSIMDFYSGKDSGFAQRMLKFSLLENYAPTSFKKQWAHHFWMLFEPSPR
ncbi:MAG: class I SAM-dependent methyltransferase [Candidatus Cloacimonadaceae bacterium]